MQKLFRKKNLPFLLIPLIFFFLSVMFFYDNKYSIKAPMPQDNLLSLTEEQLQSAPIFLIDEWLISDGINAPGSNAPSMRTWIGEYSNYRRKNASDRSPYGSCTYQLQISYEGENTIVEGTVSMTQLWQQPQSTSGYLTTTNANRSMAYYDGALYIPNKDAGTFAVVDASTGALRTTRTITASAFWQHNLRITSDGQMLLGNTGAGSTSLLVKSSSLNNGGATDLNTFAISGRTDYFYSYGDWNGTGFLLALSNTGNLLKVPFVGGLLGAETSVSNASLPSGTSSKAIPADAASFYASTANRLPSRHDIQTGNLLESFDAANAPEAVNASGMAVFSMQGHTYMVLPHDVFGSFEVYEITYGLSNAKRVIEATATLGSNTNAAFTVDFCTAVEDTEATIYVLAPNNGVAAYRFVFTPKETALPQVDDTDNVLIRSTIDGVAVSFEGTKTVEVYAVNGILLDRQTVSSSYSSVLPQGMYILRVGDSVHKFIK